MNPQNSQTPLDYLNQIAPQGPKKPLFALNLRTILLAGVAAIILIIIIVNVANAISSTNKTPWQRYAARVDATITVVDGATKHIKSSQLRSINSDLKLYLTNTKRDIATPLTALEINPTKLPAKIVAEEKGTDIAQRLEDGRLNAKYDSTYAREMTYQVATLLSLQQQLYATNIGPKTKEMLKQQYDNLLPSYTTLSEFSTSTE